jgi:hypothetical protein
MVKLRNVGTGKISDPVSAKSRLDVALYCMLVVPGGSRFAVVGNVFAQEPVSKIGN